MRAADAVLGGGGGSVPVRAALRCGSARVFAERVRQLRTGRRLGSIRREGEHVARLGAGAGGGLELYTEGTDGTGSVKVATFAAADTNADGDVAGGAVTNAIMTEESDFAIKMVTAVASAGDITFVVEYVLPV